MRCPKCGEEIDRLYHSQTGTMYYHFSLDGYEEDEFIGDDAGNYECPECNTILAQNEEDAEGFLKGEINEEMAKYYLELALGGKE